MKYLKIDTNKIILETDLKKTFSNVSFSLPLSASSAEYLGLKTITETPEPSTDDFYHAEEDGIEEVAGQWRTKWKSVSDFEEYTDAKTNETITVASQINDFKSNNARATRDQLLAGTDHYGLSDVTMTEAMTAYRQALRDVPQQEGFPQTITWPTKPE